MLGKLYITSTSSAEKLQLINDLVIEAIDSKIASEASSRTALNKLHLAVGKALGEGNGRPARKSSEETDATEMVVDTEAPDVDADAEADASGNGNVEGVEGGLTKVDAEEAEADTVTAMENLKIKSDEFAAIAEPTKDSILDDLLDDDDDEDEI